MLSPLCVIRHHRHSTPTDGSAPCGCCASGQDSSRSPWTATENCHARCSHIRGILTESGPTRSYQTFGGAYDTGALGRAAAERVRSYIATKTSPHLERPSAPRQASDSMRDHPPARRHANTFGSTRVADRIEATFASSPDKGGSAGALALLRCRRRRQNTPPPSHAAGLYSPGEGHHKLALEISSGQSMSGLAGRERCGPGRSMLSRLSRTVSLGNMRRPQTVLLWN